MGEAYIIFQACLNKLSKTHKKHGGF